MDGPLVELLPKITGKMSNIQTRDKTKDWNLVQNAALTIKNILL